MDLQNCRESLKAFRIASLPPEFYYIPNFITAEEEASIMNKASNYYFAYEPGLLHFFTFTRIRDTDLPRSPPTVGSRSPTAVSKLIHLPLLKTIHSSAHPCRLTSSTPL